MKRLLTISSLLFAVAAFVGVSCAVAAPDSTTGIEKAITPAQVSVSAISAGASFVLHNSFSFVDATFTDAMVLNKIYWVADEEFYSRGYKAKLSGAITEILAPPIKRYFKHRCSRNC